MGTRRPRRYRVEFSPAADRDFRALDPEIQRRLRPRIDALAENPRPAASKKLTGAEDLYRLRVGDCRIVYGIRDRVLLVLVVRIAHRREVYR